jgi:LPS-assembly protein
VVIPTLSIDSGLFLERDATDTSVQTLEPRAMLSWTQSKRQTGLPNYDSGDVDFNMSSIFSPYPISGNDRVADMKALTLGLTSRWLDRDSGRESWSVGVAQRLRIDDQVVQVSDSADPLTVTWSDVLVEGRLSWSDQWSGALTVQVDQDTNRIRRSTSSVTYTPTNYRSLSVGYSLARDTSELAHVAWQWPLNDLWGDRGRDLGPGRGLGTPRWYSVGRLNYSVMDRKLTDLIAGFEYDAGCWVGRIVVERLQTSSATANQRILFQLELNGFSRLGSSPLALLQDNIPRYQYLRQEVVAPSRFVNYE